MYDDTNIHPDLDPFLVLRANGTTATDWYTIKAVGQDNFEDVKVPDTPRQSQQLKQN